MSATTMLFLGLYVLQSANHNRPVFPLPVVALVVLIVLLCYRAVRYTPFSGVFVYAERCQR